MGFRPCARATGLETLAHHVPEDNDPGQLAGGKLGPPKQEQTGGLSTIEGYMGGFRGQGTCLQGPSESYVPFNEGSCKGTWERQGQGRALPLSTGDHHL